MQISEINIYPIKSLGGVKVKSAPIESRGLRYDRRWMLIDDRNTFISQREFPEMAAFEVKIEPENLAVTAHGAELLISFDAETTETETVQIWSSRVKARIYPAQINEFFSDILRRTVRLALMPEETRRRVSYFYAVHKDDHVSFADGYPFLLIGENSLVDLNKKLAAPVPMNRFRPNFVTAGGEPFAEDAWRKIAVGENIFHVVKPCARCVMTTIDQQTGEKTGVEPLKTLAGYRIPKRSVKKKILFGQNLIVEKPGGTVELGDEVRVLEMR